MPVKGSRVRVELLCQQCGSAFETYPCFSDARYCSPRCVGVATAARRWRLSAEERFWSKVNKDGPIIRPDLGPCWIWIGGKQSQGYGIFSLNGVPILAHRAAFVINGEPLVDKALHHCDNRPCVRRSHLFSGTQQDNVDDMVAKGRQNFGARANVPKGDHHYLRLSPERSHRAKFTADQVRAIRLAYADGKQRYSDISASLGIHEGTIARIVRRETYRHVT